MKFHDLLNQPMEIITSGTSCKSGERALMAFPDQWVNKVLFFLLCRLQRACTYYDWDLGTGRCIHGVRLPTEHLASLPDRNILQKASQKDVDRTNVQLLHILWSIFNVQSYVVPWRIHGRHFFDQARCLFLWESP